MSMFKLGEYDVAVARDIADRLKDAGLKVDVRTFTDSQIELFHHLHGRMSEIKGEITEKEFSRYMRYLAVLRKVLAEGAIAENYSEKLELELDPLVKEKRKIFGEMIEGTYSDEERAAKSSEHPDLMSDLLDVSNATSFADMVLEINDIQIGEILGGRLDDPIVRVFADDEDDESSLARTTTVFTVDPMAEVFVDEFTAVFSEDIDEAFEEEYHEEYARLFFLGKLISELAEPSSGKVDMEAFAERCEFQMENKGNLLEIDGRRAAEELARSLEKNGIIKVKGESVKWRR
ncbi:MAG: hypothetical protein A4E48_00104 [Methanosaeta sp. PtaU1.Bin060]|nr:MAG: hypothetical protein A4E48_00104 [Methanosaeta sp. PtaU1.Bin060]